MVKRGCTAEKIAARLEIIRSTPALQSFEAHTESEFAAILAPLCSKVGQILETRIVSVLRCFVSLAYLSCVYAGVCWNDLASRRRKNVRDRALGRQHSEALQSRHHQKGR